MSDSTLPIPRSTGEANVDFVPHQILPWWIRTTRNEDCTQMIWLLSHSWRYFIAADPEGSEEATMWPKTWNCIEFLVAHCYQYCQKWIIMYASRFTSNNRRQKRNYVAKAIQFNSRRHASKCGMQANLKMNHNSQCHGKNTQQAEQERFLSKCRRNCIPWQNNA